MLPIDRGTFICLHCTKALCLHGLELSQDIIIDLFRKEMVVSL